MFDKFLSWAAKHKDTEPAPTPSPFPEEDKDFYFNGDEERIQRFNRLVHLLSSGGVLLVLGESGVGKSVLLRELLNSASDSCRICQLSPGACIDPHQALGEMLDCFAWRADIDRSLDDTQLRCLREQLGSMRRNGYAPVLVIDDAEALPDTVFAILEQLFDSDGADILTLVMAGDPRLKQRISTPLLQSLNTHVAHELEIQPFSSEEQMDYIRQHLQRVGFEGMGPFQTKTLKFIHVASRGVPRRINELARVFWASNKTTLSTRKGMAWLTGPRLKQLRLILPLLIISSAAALFYNQFRSTPSQVTSTEQVSTDISELNDERLRADVRGGDNQSVPASMVAASEDSTQSMTEVADTRQQDADGSTQSSIPADVAQQSPPLQIDAQLQQQKESSTDSTVSSEAAAAAVLVLSQPGQGPNEGDTGSDRRQGSAAAPQADLSRSDGWWLTQPASQFAVQLMAMQGQTVRDYIARHGLEAFNVATFRVRGAQQYLLAAALGPFATRTEADAAARQWQQRLPGIKPWVRSVASIQQVVADNRRQAMPDWMAVVAKHEQNLLKQRPQDYAVQLMAMDQATVTGFVAKYGLTDRVMYFRTRSGGRVVYAALLGSYPSRQQAEEASQLIAQQTRGVRPWVRSLASVQQVIRTHPDHPR